MTLIELIRKRKPVALATAIPATPATEEPESRPSVATVAKVAVAQPHRENCEPTSTNPDVVMESAAPPLQPGWRVVYMDHQGKLAGGSDDPAHATVAECRWVAGAWTVTLTDGQTMLLSRVRSVGAVDHKGRLYGAWTVREHGYDGEGLCKGQPGAISPCAPPDLSHRCGLPRPFAW
jgi:hypothetical protein